MKMPWRSSKTVEGQVQKLISYLGLTKEEFDTSIVEEENPKYWKSAVYTKIFQIYPFVNPTWLKNDEGGMILSTVGSPLNRLLGCCICKNIRLVDIAHTIDWNPKMMFDILSNDDDATKALLQLIMLKYKDINPEWLLNGRPPVVIRQIIEREPEEEEVKEEEQPVMQGEQLEPEHIANYVERRVDRLNKFIKSGHATLSYIEDISLAAAAIVKSTDPTVDLDDKMVDVIADNCRYVNREWLRTGEGEMINTDIKENASDRLMKYIKFKRQITKPFLKACGLYDGILSRADIGADISDKAIDKVCAYYKDLNKQWLKTGEGEMIIPHARFKLEPHYSRNIFLDRTGNCLDRVYQYTKVNKMSIDQLSKKCGIAESTLPATKTQKKDIGDQTVAKILETCPDINPDWLWHGNGDMMKRRGRKPKKQIVEPEPIKEEPVTEEKQSVDVKIEEVLNIEVELFNNVIVPLSLINATQHDNYMFFAIRDDKGEIASIGLTNNMIRSISIIKGQDVQGRDAKDILIGLCSSDIKLRT